VAGPLGARWVLTGRISHVCLRRRARNAAKRTEPTHRVRRSRVRDTSIAVTRHTRPTLIMDRNARSCLAACAKPQRTEDRGALPFSQQDLILRTSVLARTASPTRPGVPPAAPPRRRRVHKAASDVRVGRVDGRGTVRRRVWERQRPERPTGVEPGSVRDRSTGARVLRRLFVRPAGAGAGAGVSDAIMRTQISHRRTFQHRPGVSQA